MSSDSCNSIISPLVVTQSIKPGVDSLYTSISNVRLQTQCSRCLGMTVHPEHPSVIDESLFSLVGSRTLSPCAANTTCYRAALHSMLMLFVALKALWGSALAARARRTASVVPERGGSGVFCSCAPAAVVASGIVKQVLCLDWDAAERVFIRVCMTTTAFPVICLARVFLHTGSAE